MRLCFSGFCLGHQRPLAVEQGSQTALTLATAIDNHNVTTFFNKGAIFDDEAVSLDLDSKKSSEMIAQDDPNFQQMIMEPSNPFAENELDTQNNNTLEPSNIELIKDENLNDATAEAVSNMIISDTTDEYMNELETKLTPREMELIKVIQAKDLHIKELEALLSRKDDEIANLRSHLDKFQSVFPFSQSQRVIAGRKMGRSIARQRATGISAEPQSQNSMHELLNVSFPKYEKQER